MSEQEIYYTPQEVARMLKVDRNTVYRYLSSGELNAFYVGRQRRISKTELDKFLSERK